MTRRELEKRIARKEQEIADLRVQIRDAEVYIGALQDVLRLIPKGSPEDEGAATTTTLRANSAPARARDAILKAGRPLHIADLLKAMGLPTDRKSRGGLSGTLSPYVRRGEIFTRPAPNTFGLKELGVPPPGVTDTEDEPPDSFGSDEGEDPELASASQH